MPADPCSLLRSRRVAAELRRIRETLGLSRGDVGRRLGVSAGKLRRIESGRHGPVFEEVAELLGLYEVPEPQRADLLGVARRSNGSGWWHGSGGRPRHWRTFAAFEAQATHIRCFELLLVPELLQTREYARLVVEATGFGASPVELDERVAGRMERQAVLRRADPPEVAVIIGEDALGPSLGPAGVLRRQFWHLLAMAERPNVTVRVITRSAGAHPGLQGGFIALGLRQEPDVVFVPTQVSAHYLARQTDLELYQRIWDGIADKALEPAETVHFLRGRLVELDR